MARPRSEDKKNAILAAATRVIAAQGLAAPTSLIAMEAGISNGSLFTYFETKADLLNALYVELKTEMASAALCDLSPDKDVRDQMATTCSSWCWNSLMAGTWVPCSRRTSSPCGGYWTCTARPLRASPTPMP